MSYGEYTYSENAIHRAADTGNYATVDVTAYRDGTISLYSEGNSEDPGTDVRMSPAETRALMHHLDQALHHVAVNTEGTAA